MSRQSRREQVSAGWSPAALAFSLVGMGFRALRHPSASSSSKDTMLSSSAPTTLRFRHHRSGTLEPVGIAIVLFLFEIAKQRTFPMEEQQFPRDVPANRPAKNLTFPFFSTLVAKYASRRDSPLRDMHMPQEHLTDKETFRLKKPSLRQWHDAGVVAYQELVALGTFARGTRLKWLDPSIAEVCSQVATQELSHRERVDTSSQFSLEGSANR